MKFLAVNPNPCRETVPEQSGLKESAASCYFGQKGRKSSCFTMTMGSGARNKVGLL